MRISIIGAGNMGGATALGFARFIPDVEVTATAKHQETLNRYSSSRIKTTLDNCSAVKEAELVIMGVKPWLLKEVLTPLLPFMEGKILVSLAAGIPAATIKEWTDGQGIKGVYTVIPNLAIHMNRGMNDSVKYDPARDLVALYCEGENKGRFYEEIAQAAGCRAEDIISSDLYLYNNQPGTVWGPSGEFVSSPRLDDLACVFACTEAFLSAKKTDRIPVLCVFDNEEIGSGTKQGAGSDFLPRILSGISRGLGLSENAHYALLDNSFFISCDNGHAKHPNHPEMADTNEFPVLNGGIVIKHSPRYATDSVSCAVFTEICRRAGAKVQSYANRPDIAGGGTLGLIADTKTPVFTVDIGIGQLAMHSCFETMGSRELDDLILGVKAAYEAKPNFTAESVEF